MTSLPDYLRQLRRSRGLSAESLSLIIQDAVPADVGKRSASTICSYIWEFEKGLGSFNRALAGDDPYKTVLLLYVGALNPSEEEQEALSQMLSPYADRKMQQSFFREVSRLQPDPALLLTPGKMLDKLPDGDDKDQLVRKVERLYQRYSGVKKR